MPYSEIPEVPQTEEAGSNIEFQPVTIPYFLYAAMARSYYSDDKNVDLPVPEVPFDKQRKVGGDLNLKGISFNPSDIPSHWKPGGVASKDS